MNTNDLKRHFGSIAKAASAIGVHRQAVYEWDKRGGIPEGQQFKIHVLTKGKLKVDAEYLTAKQARRAA